ncbi:3'-5' exonuclease [Intestinicryptomonas porci]|uniref:3'-5' exonuclease n=1 Tax=Intestinicryptomonas porci TaxID=2926320 RepID=A0ABU4WIA6_9BACT|nr:hypothetical protein [Opitutales bacterium CLA-KB-P66]
MKNEIPIYAIDFEGSKAIGIVEFGVAGILNGDIFFSDTKICAPKKSIDLKTRKITGITDSLAGQNPPFEAHCEMFSSLRQNGIFAAHNFHTEDSLLRHYIPSAGRVKNFFTGKDTLSWSPWIDSRIVSRQIFSVESEKLSDVVSELGLQDELDFYAEKICPATRKKWHCALYDALASALIIKLAIREVTNLNALAEALKIETRESSLF